MGAFKGAVVLSFTKELINQAYVQARLLDPLGLMSINRMTSSLQMKTPIVEHITPEDDKQPSQEKEADLFEISLANVINNASWAMSDVIMATPVTLAHVMQRRDKFSPFDMNPRIVVLDECD